MFSKTLQKLKIVFLPVRENEYRPSFLKTRVLVYILVALLVLKLFTIPFFLVFQNNVFFANIVEKALVNSANQDRQSFGMGILRENPQLTQAAYLKAKDMFEKGYFDHHSPDGLSPWYWFRLVGYNYQHAGENLAIGFLDSEQVHRAWMDSSGHRANLLNPSYQETGIAVVRGEFQGNETTIVVQLFAVPGAVPIQEPETGVAVEEQPIDILQEDEQVAFEPEAEAEAEQEPEAEAEAEQEPEIEVLPGVIAEQRGVLPSATFLQAQESSRPRGLMEEMTFAFLSFLSSDYYKVLQAVIYGLLTLVTTVLIINVVIGSRLNQPEVIFKTFIFFGVLISFILVDKVDMLDLVSRNFAIN